MRILKLGANIKRVVKIAANFIRQGKVLLCPTDTVYGLIADATNKKAVEKVFQIKGRQRNKPLPIFVKDLSAAKKLVHINKKQERFLKKVWPGKITVVLKKKKRYKIYGVDKNTLALRIPNYKFVSYLLSLVDSPLTGTSANLSGKPASTKIKEVLSQLEDRKIKPDLIINAGNLKKAEPSSIIDLTQGRLKILRKGDEIPKIII
jgi:L-threonylcarbamoyladenylate synthase